MLNAKIFESFDGNALWLSAAQLLFFKYNIFNVDHILEFLGLFGYVV